MKVLFYKCETPLHIGTGDDMGYIKMPIKREIHTGFPVIEASGIKGAYRSRYSRIGDKDDIDILFGTDEDKDNNALAGHIIFHDARILFFPVKTRKGLFKWITCPYVLQRWLKDNRYIGQKDSLPEISNWKDIKKDLYENRVISFERNDNQTSEEDKLENIFLEEHKFIMSDLPKGMQAVIESIKAMMEDEVFDELFENACIVGDEQFQYFVEVATEVNTRIKINDELGTAEDKHLFTEEYVPSETIFYTFIGTHRTPLEGDYDQHIKEMLDKARLIQMGGNTTLGKGLIHVVEGRPLNGQES